MASSLDKCPICNLSAEVETLVNDYNQHYYFCVICAERGMQLKKHVLTNRALSRNQTVELYKFISHPFK